MDTSDTSVIDRLLDPLAQSFSREAAAAIVNYRADKHIQAHIDQLAEKANEGQLSAAERQEYEAYIEAIDLIAILQAKARKALERQSRP